MVYVDVLNRARSRSTQYLKITKFVNFNYLIHQLNKWKLYNLPKGSSTRACLDIFDDPYEFIWSGDSPSGSNWWGRIISSSLRVLDSITPANKLA